MYTLSRVYANTLEEQCGGGAFIFKLDTIYYYNIFVCTCLARTEFEPPLKTRGLKSLKSTN